MDEPTVISLQLVQLLHGSNPVPLVKQFNAFANILAVVVFPVPR
jgi:hypothetical protein